MERISKLKFLTLRFRDRDWPDRQLDWSNNPIRLALLHLLHLPTITHFKLTGVENFVVSDLIPCVNLKYLHIDYLSVTLADKNIFPSALPEPSIQFNEFVVGIRMSNATSTGMKLCTAPRPDSQPIVDFGSLSKIRIAIGGLPHDDEVLQELFKHCCVLTIVSITCK